LKVHADVLHGLVRDKSSSLNHHLVSEESSLSQLCESHKQRSNIASQESRSDDALLDVRQKAIDHTRVDLENLGLGQFEACSIAETVEPMGGDLGNSLIRLRFGRRSSSNPVSQLANGRHTELTVVVNSLSLLDGEV